MSRRGRRSLAVGLGLAGPSLAVGFLHGGNGDVAELAELGLLTLVVCSTWLGGRGVGAFSALCAAGALAHLHHLTFGVDALFVLTAFALAGVLLPHLVRSEADTRREAARLGREYGLLLAALGEGIVAMDFTGKITLTNPAAAQMLGYTPEEMLGRDARALYHHSHPDGTPREGPLTVDEEQGGRVEGDVFWRKDGTSFPVVYTVTRLAGEDGDQDGAVVVFRDITRRVLREEELREREELFRAVFEGAAVGISLTDPQGTLVDVNPAYAEMLGYPREVLRNRNLAEFTHPEDLQGNLARLETAFHGTSSRASFRKRYLREDGTVRWANVAPAMIHDRTGQPRLGLAMVEDITDRLAAETALRESEQRFRELVQNIPEAFFLTEVADKPHMLYISPAYERIWGRSCQSLYADSGSWLDAVHPDDRERVLTTLAQPGTEAREYEYRIIRPDGSVRIVAASAYLIEGEGGQVRRAGVATDVTERRQLEEQVRATLDAERANNLNNEFLSRVSHELRTPLNAILGFGQLLELADLSPAEHQNVERILQAGRHLLTLVTELLEISQLDAGGSTPELMPVDLCQVAQTVADLLAPVGDEHDVAIELDLPNKALAQANEPLLRKAVLNVVSNAIKYNVRDGKVRLSIEHAGGRLQLRVADSGPGIPGEQLRRLFRPFDRLDSEQAGVEGTGLGLTVARTLVEAMAGTIQVESQPGIGSTFTIHLPAAETADPETADHDVVTRTDSPAASQIPVRESGKLKVLYIEDNPANLLLVKSILDLRPQIELLSAARGTLGLDLAQAHQPDLILLDLNLPDLSGDLVLARLRGDSRTAHIPVIMLSGDTVSSHISSLLAAGAAGYLTKPISVPQLLSIVDDSLAA